MDTAKECTVGTYCGANTTTAGGTDNCPPRWQLGFTWFHALVDKRLVFLFQSINRSNRF